MFHRFIIKLCIVYFLLFAGGSKEAYSQVLNELKQIYQSYKSIDTLETDMVVKMYGESDRKAIIKQMSLKKIDNSILYNIDGNLMLNTPKYSIYANNYQRQLILSSNEKKKFSDNMSLNDLDTLMNMCDSVSSMLVIGTTKEYCIYNNKSVIYRTCLTIDTVSHFLTYLTYDYSESYSNIKRVEISVRNSVKGNFDPKVLSFNYYITVTGDKKYVPSKNFSSYELITVN